MALDEGYLTAYCAVCGAEIKCYGAVTGNPIECESCGARWVLTVDDEGLPTWRLVH